MKERFIFGIILITVTVISGCTTKYEKELSDSFLSNQTEFHEDINNERGIEDNADSQMIDSTIFADDNFINLSIVNEHSLQAKKRIRFDANRFGFYRIGTQSDNPLFSPSINRIYYFDYASGMSQLLCNDINCTHDNIECPACLYDSDYYCNYIFCNDSKLYLVAKKEDGAYLEEANLDGTNRRICTKLWQINSAVFNDTTKPYMNLMIRDEEYIYYFVNEDYQTLGLYAVNLQDYSVERVYYEEVYGEDMVYNVGEFIVTDSKIVFSVCNYSSGQRNTKIVAIDKMKHSQISTVLETNYYGSRGNFIYYSQPHFADNIVAYNLETGVETIVIDKQKGKNDYAVYYYVVCTDKYIVLDNLTAFLTDENVNKRVIEFYDYSYNLINTLEVFQEGSFEYFDGSILTYVESFGKMFDEFHIITFDEAMNITSDFKVPNLGFGKPGID